MAGRARDYETKVILRRLLTFVIAFYALYYVVGAVLAAITGQPVTATIPFDHVEFGTGKGRPLLTFLTTVITYTLGLALVVIIIQTSANAWDYAVTTSLLHLLLASIVCLKFPVNWVWDGRIASSLHDVAARFPGDAGWARPPRHPRTLRFVRATGA